MLVLLIEDDADIRDMYRQKLTVDGYAVMCAADGQDGLDKARRFRPDIILLDLDLPRRHGFEVMQALRSGQRTARTPVIILSNHAGRELRQRGLALGANHYLIKAATTPSSLSADIAAWVHE